MLRQEQFLLTDLGSIVPHTRNLQQNMPSSSGPEQYLAGKLAIVTGAAKANGIGFASALALAEHGADVSLLLPCAPFQNLTGKGDNPL